MTKKQILAKNIQLSEKLANFIVKSKHNIKKISTGDSYVVFSATDKTLNRMNKRLVDSLVKQGKKVIKAEETEDNKDPWKFTPAWL